MWNVIGHSEIINFFEKSIKDHTLVHSFLVTGIPGVGKKELVISLARRLLCTSDDSPCGVCNTCRKVYDPTETLEISRYKHPDVFYIGLYSELDDNGKIVSTKSEIVIDQIREMQKNVTTAPFEGNARIFIIDDADKMTIGAANALLKLLEEPPNYVYIFLLTSNPGSLLETIVSRCYKIDLLPVPLEIIKQQLIDNYHCDKDHADLIASLSNGAPLKAIQYVSDDTLWEDRTNIINDLLNVIPLALSKRFDYASKYNGTGADKRLNVISMLETWLVVWRDILLINVGLDNNVINKDYITQLKSFSCKMDTENIRKYLFEIKRVIGSIKGNANIQLSMEVLMLDMPKLLNI